ncbi:MAG: 30S ribosomal protein S16 [Chloroflexota bacterium]
MAVKIRLRRVGAKKQPMYRLVATDERAPRDGGFLEIVGQYNPLTDPATINVKEDRVLHWLGQGAQTSDVVAKILTKTGVLERFQESKRQKRAERSAEAAEGKQ